MSPLAWSTQHRAGLLIKQRELVMIFSRSLMYKLLTNVTNGDKIVLGE